MSASASRPRGCRAGPTPALLPVINLALALRCPASSSSLLGENPLGRPAAARGRRLRHGGGDRLHALLRDELRLHRPGRGRRLPRRALQHRRGGPGLHRRPRRRRCSASGPAAGRSALVLPAAVVAAARLRRRLGVHPGVAPGPARQPRRHHDDHVQLHRLGADDLSPGQRADQARPAVAGDAGVRPEHLAAPAPRRGPGVRLGDRPLAAQPLVRPRPGRRRARLALSSGTRAGATSCARSATARRPRSTPASRPRAR